MSPIDSFGYPMCAVSDAVGQELRCTRLHCTIQLGPLLLHITAAKRRTRAGLLHLPASSKVAPQKDGRGEARGVVRLVAEISQAVAAPAWQTANEN